MSLNRNVKNLKVSRNFPNISKSSTYHKKHYSYDQTDSISKDSSLADELLKLRKINKYLQESLIKKDAIILELMNKIKSLNFQPTKQNERKQFSQSIKSVRNIDTSKKMTTSNFIEFQSNYQRGAKKKLSGDFKRIFRRRSTDSLNLLPGDRFYESIKAYTNKNLNVDARDGRFSFLGLSEDNLYKIANAPSVNKINDLCSSDDNFLRNIKSMSDEELLATADSISLTIKDFQNSIFLINKLKSLINFQNQSMTSNMFEVKVRMILKNIVHIVDCEKASIFIYEKQSDSLVVHSGDGLTKNQIKVPKDKGIVGFVFTCGKRVRIDDAYLDERFNKEIDKQTGFRTKSILASPLFDEQGNCFGVIQAINKVERQFTNDDEELLEIFAIQTAFLMRSAVNMDMKGRLITKLKVLINLSTLIGGISYFEFVKKIEKYLSSIWGHDLVRYFTLSKKALYYFDESEKVEVDKTKGLCKRVIESGMLVTTRNPATDYYFNSIVDIDSTFSLLTWPIFSETGEVLAVIQNVYPMQINSKTNLPFFDDLDFIKAFQDCMSVWLMRFFKDEFS